MKIIRGLAVALLLPALLQTTMATTKLEEQHISVKDSVSFKKPLPFDNEVKVGKLPNGFQYFIRKNVEPKNRVTMYLAVKVGSILETESQLGLAHFLEHMNFNGLKHFPKNELVNYLQKVGVRFGSDLNYIPQIEMYRFSKRNVPFFSGFSHTTPNYTTQQKSPEKGLFSYLIGVVQGEPFTYLSEVSRYCHIIIGLDVV